MLSGYIGPVTVDHTAYEVQSGRMEDVLDFFLKQLGWSEDVARRKMRQDWGEARFLRSHILSPVLVQLTDAVDRMPGEIYKGIHLGLSVANAMIAAGHMVEWAQEQGYEMRVELGNELGTKVFVYFPELMTFGLELVSKDHECD